MMKKLLFLLCGFAASAMAGAQSQPAPTSAPAPLAVSASLPEPASAPAPLAVSALPSAPALPSASPSSSDPSVPSDPSSQSDPCSRPVFSNEDLTITELEKGVWVVETTDKTTMYIVEGTDRALLIDTGTNPRDLDKVVRHVTQKPLDVVLTHCHYDHAGGVRYFSEIYMHPADTTLMRHLPHYAGKVHPVTEGDVFDLGGKRLEVVEMPGHTPGSIVLMDWAEGICYAGDAVGSGQVWLQLNHSLPIGTYLQTLARMESMMDRGITRIYCGHYPYQKRPLGRDYLDDMKRCARSIFDGEPMNPAPFGIIVDIGCGNPQTAACGSASIVYNPENIR